MGKKLKDYSIQELNTLFLKNKDRCKNDYDKFLEMIISGDFEVIPEHPAEEKDEQLMGDYDFGYEDGYNDGYEKALEDFKIIEKLNKK